MIFLDCFNHCSKFDDMGLTWTYYISKRTSGSAMVHFDIKYLSILNRTLKNCINHAKKIIFQEYVREVETLPAMAKLSKILRAKPTSELGLVKKPDRSLCTSPEESLATMVQEHFPGSVVTDTQASPPPRSTEIKVEPIPWITSERTWPWATINSFGPHKACGPDKLMTVVLQHLSWEAVDALSNIFTAVIELGYVPTRWRTSDVIFIDKPGKTDFEKPRSFRPISLMSFVYETTPDRDGLIWVSVICLSNDTSGREQG
jgi:hypothetical protein